MEKFAYEILVARDTPSTPTGITWVNSAGENLGVNLPKILNQLGQEGWEVVAIGDLGFSPRPELLLKKRLE